MEPKVIEAALAGLLHDIGKFVWRAHATELRKSWSEEHRQQQGYWHVLASDSFIADHVPKGLHAGLTGVRYHHHPDSDDALPDDSQPWQVQLADRLSSGEREEDEDALVPYLRSIFSRLNRYDQPWYLPLKRLELSEGTLFPHETSPNEWQAAHEAEYARLWSEFETACRQARLSDFGSDEVRAYLDTLYSLLQEFTWCIPSAYHQAVPDVSLFDHARTTAALAACFAADRRDRAWCKQVFDDLGQQQGDQMVCQLVGGDISGVQTFIYTLASSGAARSLRARSFYLQMLTEVVARYILDELGLPITNLLYAGGGNFFILVGMQPAQDLRDINRKISEKLLAAHGGALHLALASTSVRAAEFEHGKFHVAWDRLHQQLSIEKHRPLADLVALDLAREVGTASGEGGDVDTVCDVCGREASAAIPPDEDGVRRCAFCDSLEHLGAQLSHATHLVWLTSSSEEAVSADPAEWWRVMMAFRTNVFAVNANEPPRKDRYINFLPESLTGLHVNELRAQANYASQLRTEISQAGVRVLNLYRPFAQLVPFSHANQIMTFDELAKTSRGINRWGVLRMDVDNLGDLFRHGFAWNDANNLTLSRVASLSMALRLFFEGWLPRLGQVEWAHSEIKDPAEGQVRKNTLYVQYAGGDDVFIVGAWDALPEFAARIRSSLEAYTCRNPRITVSAGMTLAGEKFPLYQAADQAHAAEEAAKSFKRASGNGEHDPEAAKTAKSTVNDDQRDKDAVCLFEQTIGWEQFGEVRRRARLMAEWCDGSNTSGKALPRSIIQSFLAIDAEFQRGLEARTGTRSKRRDQFYYGPWLWHAVYRLTRVINSLPTYANDAAQELKRWEKDVLDPKEITIVTIGLSARWAELLIRKESKE